MSTKELTPVEWFIEQLEEKGSASENVSIRRLEISIDVSEYLDLKRKAKEIEKDRIIDAHTDWARLTENLPTRTAEQYYKETFKQQYQ